MKTKIQKIQDGDKDLHKNNFYAEDIQKEIDKYNNECFDILQHNERIQKFKEVYKAQFGIELADKEALEYSIILLNSIKLIVNLSKNKNSGKNINS